MLLYKNEGAQQTMYREEGVSMYKNEGAQQTMYREESMLMYKNEGAQYVLCIPCVTIISSCERNVRRLDVNVLLHNFYETQELTRNCIHVLYLLLNTL